MKFLKVMAWVVGVPVGLFVLLVAYYAVRDLTGNSSPSDDAKANSRSAIEMCWSSQAKKSNSGGDAQFIAGACERMEDKFRKEHGVSP